MRPVKYRRKTTWIIFSVLLLAVLTFFTGRYFFFYQIHKALHTRLHSLEEKGIAIGFESAKINAWTGKIEVQHLVVALGKDTANRSVKVVIPYLLVKDIAVIPFIKDRSLQIGTISVAQPTVSLMSKKQSWDNETKKEILENIGIDVVDITDAILYVKDSLDRDTVAHLSANFSVRQLGLERVKDSLVWREADIDITNLALTFPAELYSCKAKHVQLDLNGKAFVLDSLMITPTVGRRAFMKKFGKEIDYIKGSVAFLKASGLNLFSYPKLSLEADKIDIRCHLDVFRDKRLPFRKNYHTTLPVHFLQRMPVALSVDTVRLSDSYVSYEEFPEEGDSSGRVYFEKLNATIAPLHNNPSRKQDIKMIARGKLMGDGDLRVRITFPNDTTRPCRARGSLRNLSMARLNNMLGPAAKVRIESGTMTHMKFHFMFNLYRADGEVELNYENLRITSLRENKKNKQAVSLIKTLLLNTFIIKKNMDEDLADDKKTGTILFYRNTKRSIFNYMWKSVLSGVKSAYKLDRLPPIARNGKKKNQTKAPS